MQWRVQSKGYSHQSRYVHRLSETKPSFFKGSHFWEPICLHRIRVLSCSLYLVQNLTHLQGNLPDCVAEMVWRNTRGLFPKLGCWQSPLNLYWHIPQPCWSNKLSSPKGVLLWGQRRAQGKEADCSWNGICLVVQIPSPMDLHCCANIMSVLGKALWSF